ncbi:glycosyltransferase family 4 protein [Vreelandella neptunia]|uniref:Glycosyltransferase family 4 protein n=1 Tax=Vreelandella neptunia TaxID=115551 RepID=A0ABS9S536_9GAMM|nr:glycosyltransferase family 4 protein [Halomonas neptunia]MCH4811232.1 glycosyltransferase family 4 protein [Halomonas neptunia]
MHIIHVNLAKGFRGGERQTALLIQSLENLVAAQTLVCRHDSPLRDKLEDVANLRLVDANHQLAGHVRAGKASVVHAHEAKAVHWAWLHKRLYRTPYVVTRRVDTIIKDKWANRLFYGDADCCVAISSIIQQQLMHWTQYDIPVIPSAMSNFIPDNQVTRDFRSRYADRFIVGHIGALVDRHKGQRVILDAASQLQKSHPNLLFVFFGQGEDENVLRQESQHLANVVWAGFEPNIGDFISGLDLFAFPSRNEGLGSVLLDVMQAKVPIVATRVGGIPDLISHEETGLLIETGDAIALRDAVIQLAESKEYRAALAENAHHRLTLFSPHLMAQKYCDVYHSLAN